MRKSIQETHIDPFVLTFSLAAKLGSIVIHAEELISSEGRVADKLSLQALVIDPEICGWLEAVRRYDRALLPPKRREAK